MKKRFSLLILVLGLCQAISAQQNYLDSLISGGINRTFRVYIPASCVGKSGCPLVINFHGNTQTATSFEEKLKFRQVADTAGFILITPDGLVDPGSPSSGQGWNVFSCCAKQDDVQFVSDLIDQAVKKLEVDTQSVYASGFSIGGFMVYELACKLDKKIAAFASVSGSMETKRLETYKPSRPVPIIEFHGTNDRLCPYNGGDNEGMKFAATDTLINFWVGINHCAPVSEVINLEDRNTGDGSTVQHITFPDCAHNGAVELYKIVNGGHRWPGIDAPNSNKDILAEQEIWRFFKKFKL